MSDKKSADDKTVNIRVDALAKEQRKLQKLKADIPMQEDMRD